MHFYSVGLTLLCSYDVIGSVACPSQRLGLHGILQVMFPFQEDLSFCWTPMLTSVGLWITTPIMYSYLGSLSSTATTRTNASPCNQFHLLYVFVPFFPINIAALHINFWFHFICSSDPKSETPNQLTVLLYCNLCAGIM